MTPRASVKPADVSARRIAEADAAGRRDRPKKITANDDMFTGDCLTHLPGRRARTPGEKALHERLDAEERADASRGVARMVMVAGHGCNAGRCFSYAHSEHQQVMLDTLEALGLRDYPRGTAR